MATQTRGLIRDQNLNVHFDGTCSFSPHDCLLSNLLIRSHGGSTFMSTAAAPLGLKSNVSKAQKNGGLGGRKALNDISNSGRPSTLQTSKKHNTKNMISIEEDIGPSKMTSSFGGNRNVSKAPEKAQTGGRKALSDLTNSGKHPHVHQALKKSQDKKLSVVAEEQILPCNVSEEQFLHNHQECIKAQGKAIDMDYFLKTVGLDNDDYSMQLGSPLSGKLKPESPPRYLDMEQMFELEYEDQSQWKKPSGQTPCGSPKSPKPCMQWKDNNFPNFMLMESPKHC
ncbi:hypothetical protein CsSME_00029213 [Camellia sinensis var. sinensis]